MNRLLKSLGLALLAAALTGVLLAPTAIAANEHFHSEKERSILTATGSKWVITAPPLFTAECNASYKGTFFSPIEPPAASALRLHPVFQECTSVLGEPTSVDSNGCNFIVKAETNATGHLPVEIECTTGSTIKITVPGCTFGIVPQATAGGFSNSNLGTGSSRDQTLNATWELVFSKTGTNCWVASGTIGTITGSLTLKGFEDKGVSGNEDESGAVYTEGALLGIWWE